MSMHRVVLHLHSNWSYDASWPLAKLARLFGRGGAHLLMMTEHSQEFDWRRWSDYVAECEAASANGARVLPGIEYSTPGNTMHILTWGLKRYLGEELPADDILAAVTEDGGLAILAHPTRRSVHRSFEEGWAQSLYAVEVWNRKTDGLAPATGAIELVRTHGLNPVVAVDFHRVNQAYPLYNVLSADIDLARASDDEVIAAVRGAPMRPRFLGLPIDEGRSALSRATINACRGFRGAMSPILKLRRRIIGQA